jgi:hypothetical protein
MLFPEAFPETGSQLAVGLPGERSPQGCEMKIMKDNL